jgi:hypothetical protein
MSGNLALVINGSHAVISGITFGWQVRCPYCRTVMRLDGGPGLVEAGLSISAAGKTCRWYQRDNPGKAPALPPACPECGRERWSDPARLKKEYREREPLAEDGTLPLLNQVWAALREQYPAQAGKADEAMRAALR